MTLAIPTIAPAMVAELTFNPLLVLLEKKLGWTRARMIVRCDRADNDPQRYHQRVQQLLPYVKILREQSATTPPAFRWMVEEFKISLFAQELGTQYPISAARLDKWLAAQESESSAL